MKPFDLEKAKAGEPVCTRDGRPARIIFLGARGLHPIVALIPDDNDPSCEEKAYTFTENGAHCCVEVEDDMDLMMTPQKIRGWMNLYKDRDNIQGVLASACVYESKEEALKNKIDNPRYIGTFPIEYEV